MQYKLPLKHEEQVSDLSFLKSTYWVMVAFLAAVLLNFSLGGFFGITAAL